MLSGFTFLCLLTINSDDLATESLNDLVTKLELEHGINIKKQSLDERFNQYAVCFLKKAVEELLNKHCDRYPSCKSNNGEEKNNFHSYLSIVIFF